VGANPTDQVDSENAPEAGVTLSPEEEAVLQAEAEALQTVEKPRFRDVWQLPTLAVSLLFLTVGLFMLMKSRPPSEFPQLLESASALTDAGRYDEGLGDSG